MASKTLLSAIEVELFTGLAAGPADLATLEGRHGLHRLSSRDFLDALVALGFLKRRGGLYGNTLESGFRETRVEALTPADGMVVGIK